MAHSLAPRNLMNPIAYLSGVVHGDGWVTQDIGLRVADEDFAAAFADALAAAFGCRARPRRDERGYWLVRTTNGTGRFDGLRAFEAATDAERGAWLRGLFDSEGNATLRPLPAVSVNSFERRVAIYSTATATLGRAASYLASLGIRTVQTATRNSAGHKGTKIVYQLRVRASREHYRRFAELVGSSIGRKRAVLNAIPASYQPPGNEHCRRAQRLGAEAKVRKTMATKLPTVVAGIRDLLSRGIKPTQRACRGIAGYNTIQGHFPQADLVTLAASE